MSYNQIIDAAIIGDITKLQLQLDSGADINQKDVNGKTALMHAAYKGHVAIVKFLLENGADPDIEDRDSDTALGYAEIGENIEIVRLLKKVTITTSDKEILLIENEKTSLETVPHVNKILNDKPSTSDSKQIKIIIFISLVVIFVLIGLLFKRNPSSTVSSSNNDFQSVQRKNANPNSQLNTSATLSQQQAVALLKKWHRAKRKIFAPPYNLNLASEILAAKAYSQKQGSVKWLRNNNNFYTFQTQSVENISNFKLYGNTAILEATISEQRTLCYKNRKGQIKISNDNNTVFDRSLDRYYLESEKGKWKIADYNTIQSIQKSPNSSRTCRIVY